MKEAEQETKIEHRDLSRKPAGEWFELPASEVMHKYKIGGVLAESAICLPVPPSSTRRPPAVRLRIVSGSLQSTGAHFRLTQDGSVSVTRSDQGYAFRCDGAASFFIANDLKHVLCYPQSETPDETIQHLFLDQVIPRILSHRGDIVLHAATVAVDGAAIAFVGESGSGKSTLCAAFCRDGHPLLGDDFVVIRRNNEHGYLAVPSYPGLRLWPDSHDALALEHTAAGPMAHYSTKVRLTLAPGAVRFRDDPLPLAALFLLTPPPTYAITIEKLTGREALLALVKSSFLLDPGDAARNKKAFRDLGELAKNLNIFRLTYPRNIALLPHVQQAIRNHIAAAI